MDPKRFLRTAQKLLVPSNDEADLRSAVSRAYYSAYHLIRIEILKQIKLTVIQQAGLGGKRQMGHEKLCGALSGCHATSNLGVHLDGLRTARVKADYDLESPLSFERAQLGVEQAHKFWSAVESFGGVSKVVAELKSYLEHIHPGA